jgi:prepilin-type processing-associated H-X9-DG protein
MLSSALGSNWQGTSLHKGLKDIRDGASNTIAVSEKGLGGEAGDRTIFGQSIWSIAGIDTNATLCLATSTNRRTYNPGLNVADWTTGNLWAFGHPHWGAFTTILPPNGPSCYVGAANPSNFWGIFTPSSHHPGGVQATMADGSVRFVSETIDCGNYGVGTVKNFGVWGAMGTVAGGEAVPEA